MLQRDVDPSVNKNAIGTMLIVEVGMALHTDALMLVRTVKHLKAPPLLENLLEEVGFIHEQIKEDHLVFFFFQYFHITVKGDHCHSDSM